MSCGKSFDDATRNQLRSHIEQQISERQGAMTPSFVQEGPPKKEKKRRLPSLKSVVTVLVVIAALCAVVYFFFKAPAYTLVGRFLGSRGKYESAASWLASAQEISKDGKWGTMVAGGMESVALKIYGEYREAMLFSDRIVQMEVTSGDVKETFKVYDSAEGLKRREVWMGSALQEIDIYTEDEIYYYVRGRNPSSEPRGKKWKSRLKKSNNKEVLEELGKYATWTVEGGTKEANGATCLVVTAVIDDDTRGDFEKAYGLGENPDVRYLEHYVGVKDKYLYRKVLLDEEKKEMTVYDYVDIEVGAALPEEAFAIPMKVLPR
jgi:hypothetical protein